MKPATPTLQVNVPSVRSGSGSNPHARLRTILLILSLLLLSACGASLVPYRITSEYGIEDPQFQRTISSLLGPPLIPGNSVVTLINGDQIFPEMLRAIRGAHASITLETFFFSSGDVGREFVSALAERAANGVKVHLIFDAVGSADLDRDDIRQMRDAGVECHSYNPLRWYDILPVGDMNHRTHRKLLIVDGRIGFTGGVGIADEWQGDARSPDEWRDTHYRIEGPAVAQIQAAFAEHWMESSGRVLRGDAYFPELQPAGQLLVQAFKSSPSSGSENVQLMYLLSIAAARREIHLATPYFVVDETTEWHLLEARRRGVRIVIIVPGEEIDAPLVRHASRHRWGPLLEAGIEIHEYKPTMYHVKLMVIDGIWTSIGSANLDIRSFKLNNETNLNILNRAIATRQSGIFLQDLEQSKRITYERWKNRPWRKKLSGALANLFSSQL